MNNNRKQPGVDAVQLLSNRISSNLKGGALLLSAALLLSGCKADQGAKTSASIDSRPEATSAAKPALAAAAPVDPAHAGTVSGTISFRGTPPPRVKIDMSMDPACAFGENESEQIVVNGGKLANVFVYIEGVPPSSAPEKTIPVVLDQTGCRYTPHVIAVQQGGTVEFRNSDRTVHNVHMVTTVGGNPSMDITENPGGQPEERQFNTPAQMTPVRCNNHPWMNAFINVADSPYFAVTGPDGRFTLPNLPAGAYTLVAVHEKLGRQEMEVTVLPHATATANLSFGH